MDEEENFIRENISALLSCPEVKIKTGETAGEWTLHENEIQYIHAMPRNIEFMLAIVNGSDCLRIEAKINRATARLSNIKVEEL